MPISKKHNGYPISLGRKMEVVNLDRETVSSLSAKLLEAIKDIDGLKTELGELKGRVEELQQERD
jgi:FtsZ-binding cell division protein ZapB